MRLSEETQERLPAQEFEPTETEKLILPLAKDYVGRRNARMALTQQESEAKKALLDACLFHNVTTLVMPDGSEVIVTAKHNVRVVKSGDEATDQEDMEL